MQNKLAIVIPAYKDTYLECTLRSIAKQTNKDFTVYIGDDASPYDLYSIIKPFEKDLNIVYKRFESNCGGSDLVKQWSRCVDLTGQEEWIWLFSDDDEMEENCVEAFYDFVLNNPSQNLVHFNVEIIDSNSVVREPAICFPEVLSATNYFKKRIRYQISSFIVEYVFKKELYNKEQGFQNFDLAWCSDDATWIKFSKEKGIRTVTGAVVRWRLSTSNISGKVTDTSFIIRKLDSNVQYIHWVEQYFELNKLADTTSAFEKFKWAILLPLVNSELSLKDKFNLTLLYSKKLTSGSSSVKVLLYLTALIMKRKLKN